MKRVEGRNYGSKETNLIQETISTMNQQLINCPLIEGVLLQEVAVSSTGTYLEHKLNRIPIGYIVVRKNSSSVVFASSGGTWNNKHIYLTSSSGTITCDLWVF